ncbi:ATP-grasp domain-containing protein [Achromobacter sp. JUb104]|uniref:ATP-grasp domain-containing protein n=1 Tax=Achromobacter sp. JUb104 TaxID=2940590 RepID=UPI0021693F98|nr:ATP-grasp domain-containing protein [Achromobacter sp. JUb104]MCS3509305.1 biotin carboxylase [Achromobacter sp. JUb104]
MIQERCLIVDPISTGSLFASSFRAHGLDSVAIRTSEYAADLSHLFKREDFSSVFDYSGDLAAMGEQLADVGKFKFVVAGSHLGLRLADELAHHLGLPLANDIALSSIRHDKYELIEWLSQNGIATPRQLLSGCWDEVQRWFEGAGQRSVVVKPRNSAGTDCVTVCHNLADLKTGFERVVDHEDRYKTLNAQALVQSYLSGTEYAIDSMSFDGHHRFLCMWRATRDKGAAPFAYVQELIAPGEPEFDVVSDYVASVLDSCQYRFGPAHTEVIVDAHGEPHIVELNARCHGTLDQTLPRMCLGTNQVEELARSFCAAKKPDHWNQPVTRRGYGLKVTLVSNFSGTIINEPDWACFTHIPSYLSSYRRLDRGGPIHVTRDMPSSPGVVFLYARSRDDLWRDYGVLRDVEKRFYAQLDLQPGPLSSDKDLATFRTTAEQQPTRSLHTINARQEVGV